MGIIQWIPGNSAEKFKHIPRSVGAKYATGDQLRSNSRKNEEMEPKQKQTQLLMCLVKEARSDAIKSNIA